MSLPNQCSKHTHRRPDYLVPTTKPCLYLRRSSVRVPLAVSQRIRKLFQWATNKLRLFPQIWRQEAVGIGYGGECRLQCVLKGLGRTG